MHGKSPLYNNIGHIPPFAGDDASGGFTAADLALGDGQEDALSSLCEDERLYNFLCGVFSNSPFLKDLGLADRARLAAILEDGPEQRIAHICSQAERAGNDMDTEAALMAALRRLKQDIALTSALSDIAKRLPLEKIMAGLSRFADCVLNAAVRFCLNQWVRQGKYHPQDAARPEIASGFTVLAMGKLGANELNYSSDIDLIILYDSEAKGLAAGDRIAPDMVRMTRTIVKILSERTAQGYVFRTDLRLRPDAGATPLAISIAAALAYYESMGQNWERAALIKARACAGDIACGEQFLREIVPFIWRRHLDFAAIADIHALKRRIHDHKGHGQIAVAGHNIKLGRGGIREIEFFVQTQQLIAGGKNTALRAPGTIQALSDLQAEGWVSQRAAQSLTQSYLFLRNVEHGIQMLHDEQTHILPESASGRRHVAALCNGKDIADFDTEIHDQLQAVWQHYSALFEDESGPPGDAQYLSLTADEDDPAMLAGLADIGYRDAQATLAIVKSWHSGRYAALRSSRSRQLLGELQPALLATLAKTDDPDLALRGFDEFLTKLPVGIQLFSMLRARPLLLDILAQIMGTAPRLGGLICRHTHILEVLLEPGFLAQGSSILDMIPEALKRVLQGIDNYEAFLDQLRLFAYEQQFLIGLRLFCNSISARQAAHELTQLADSIIATLTQRSLAVFAEQHGQLPGAKFALLAMGRMGSREMSAASDIDVILLYEYDESISASDGKRPLAPSHYFVRFTQRLIAALTVPTAKGRLYDVDFRLRPSGNAGPLATRFSAFEHYQRKEAWSWEHMALTRARIIYSSCDKFSGQIMDVISAVIKTRRDSDKLRADIREMRHYIEEQKPPFGLWDIKGNPGGLVDLEFIIQYFQLLSGHKENRDDGALLTPEGVASLAAAGRRGLLNASDTDLALKAWQFYQGLSQMLAAALNDPVGQEGPPAFLLPRLAIAAGMDKSVPIEEEIANYQSRIRALFLTIIGD